MGFPPLIIWYTSNKTLPEVNKTQDNKKTRIYKAVNMANFKKHLSIFIDGWLGFKHASSISKDIDACLELNNNNNNNNIINNNNNIY